MRVVDGLVDPERVPAEREALHRLDLLHQPLEGRALVGRLHRRDFFINLRGRNPPRQSLALDERTIEADTKPGTELLRFAERAPYTLARCLQQNLLLDAIGIPGHRQLPDRLQPGGCMLCLSSSKRNLKVAHLDAMFVEAEVARSSSSSR